VASQNPDPISQTHNASRCYLVTGVAGFIASKVAEQLLEAGHTVVGVDNLNDYYDVRLKDYRLTKLLDGSYTLLGSDPKASIYANNQQPITNNSGKFTFLTLDIENLPALEALFSAHRFDAVFNLAARAGVRYSLEFPELYRRTNVLGEENVLKCQVKYGVKKHVLASSSSVYAGCPMPFVEDAVLGPMQSPYAETKRQAEQLALDYHQKHGIDVTVLRYFTVFGPAGRPDMAPFRFIKWIDEGTPITLYGDGSQARDFTYVDDIARGTILAGKLFGGQMTEHGGQTTPGSSLPAPSYNVINLGGGNNPISLHTMIGWIETALSEKRSALSGGPDSRRAVIAAQPPSSADMKETWADITKARRLLGWEPRIAPMEGFRRTVQWHDANRGWLKDIQL
jgi:UDP-glucuronate 4-epimerase